MNSKDFDTVLQQWIIRTQEVLGVKAVHYSSDTDRLHNFKRAAAMLQTIPEKALVGMLAKHWISVLDMVDGLSRGQDYDMDLWREKLGDSINYLILLEALIVERKGRDD